MLTIILSGDLSPDLLDPCLTLTALSWSQVLFLVVSSVMTLAMAARDVMGLLMQWGACSGHWPHSISTEQPGGYLMLLCPAPF